MSKRKRKAQPGGRDRPSRDSASGPAETSAVSRPESTGRDKPKKDLARCWLLAATAALFVARPLMPSESVVQEGSGTALVMLSLLLLTAWGVYLIRQGRRELRFGATDAAVLVLLAIHSAAAVWAARTGNARAALNVLWAWIALGVGFFLLRQLLRRASEARAVVVVMIGLGAALSGYGLYQYAVEMPEMRRDYHRDPERMLRSEGLWYEPGSTSRIHFEQRLESREPYAMFALTNSLAGYLAPWLVVAIGLATLGGAARPRLRGRVLEINEHAHASVGMAPKTEGMAPKIESMASSIRRMMPGILLAALLMGACLLLTKSRSAWLAVLLGLGLIAIRRFSQKRVIGWRMPLVAAGIIVALVAGAVAVGGLDAEVLSEAGKSLGYRVQYWQSTLAMIKDHPWLGCGPGQFQDNYAAYKLPEASEEIADPHNFVLEVWATAGTLGFLALLAVLGSFGWTLWKNRLRDASDTWRDSGVQDEPADDASRWIYGGALAGFLAAWPLGTLGAMVPNMALLWLGLPLALVSVFFMDGWVRKGRLAIAVLTVGLIVLLVNLLAAGGIGFPGVAGTFWMLLAVGLFLVAAGRPEVTLSRVGAWCVVGLIVVLAGACYSTAYRPVLTARGRMAAALHAMYSPNDRQKHLQAAAEADPLWSKPFKELTLSALRKWRMTRSSDALEQFEKNAALAGELDPNSNVWWNVLGDGYAEVYDHTSDKKYLEAALDAYGRAIALYPNKAEYHANLALALHSAGPAAAARQEALEALRLDDAMPHADKKLPAKLRQRLLRMDMGP